MRALLEAGWAGCLGPLGGLMHVPPELEKTLESALRELLRSVVVDSAALAREVQEVLAAAGGRATIVPLDALRPPLSAEGKPDRWPERAKRLADLISCDSAVRPAVEATLGLVALCHDLGEARALLPELPPGSVCITADGALLASSGAITLGPAETTEVLAGERERRELPVRLAGAQQASEALEAQQQEAQNQVRALEVAVRNADLQVQQARERAERARLEALSQMRTEIAVIEEAARSDEASMARESALLDQLRAQMRELVRQAERVQKEQDVLSQQIETWQAESASDLVSAMASQGADERVRESEAVARTAGQALNNQLQAGSTLEARREAEAERITELEGSLAELSQQASVASEDAARFERETVGAARTELAVARETLRSQQAGLQRELALLERLQAQVTAREQRVAELDQEQATLSQRIADLGQDAARLSQGLERSRAQIEPAEDDLAQVGRELRALDEQGQQLRARARDAESRYDHARLDVSRVEDQVHLLTKRIEEDLGLVELELTENVTVQATLPLRPMVSELLVVEELPDGLDDEIQRLKAGLRRLRGVNPQAPEEYREVKERHQFLVEQSDDLEEA
ncbi:MAG: hypothetical protein GX557_01190, partial [Chloroflexi bacterium]|nr:hypothetical protein [Chloroflexota bacterium]